MRTISNRDLARGAPLVCSAVTADGALARLAPPCLVAPSPELLDRIAQARQTGIGAPGGPDMAAFSLDIAEPVQLGFNDSIVSPGVMETMGGPSGAPAAPASARAQLTGTLQVIVVLVDFPGTAWSAPANKFQDLFFSTGTVATGSVHEYYTEASGGKIGISGQVVGPFTLPNPLAYYANNANGTGAAPNAQDMCLDAFNACAASVNFAPYDNDNDGNVDAFVVVHAGQGAEVTGSKQDIWSHKWTLRSAQSANGKQIFAYLTIPEDSKLGVCAHELGHLLFGWPDLYDTTGASSGLGNFCLMAGGSWGGGGDTPCHPCAWCKAQQGWITVTNQLACASLTLDDVKTSANALRVWSGGATGPEYFLLENRQQDKFDQSLPGAGLLIYHVDDNQPGNTNAAHYKVGLLQADGKRELETGANRGDAGDPYPGGAGNTACSPGTMPNTNDYAGNATTVSVVNIAAADKQITFDVA